LIRESKNNKWDAIIVRETPLSLEAQAAARKMDIPVLLDMRENLAAMYSTGSRKNWIKKFFRPASLIRQYEAFVCKRFNHIFTVSDELGEWVAKNYQIQDNSLSTLSSYPSRQFLQEVTEATVRPKNKHSIRLVHTGSVTEGRGLQDVIQALKILSSKRIKISLRIIGDGKYVQCLKQLTSTLELNEKVEFLPLLPPQKVAAALSECDIGVCSYLLNQQTQLTLPGKLFEYMANGLPVLSSARKPVMKILNREQCGTVYSNRNPATIAEAVLRMIKNPKTLQQAGERGKQAILTRYNQETNLELLKSVLPKYLPGIKKGER
jgi:glycosyltransferase involved in cell wall biosynthesis